MIHQIQIIDENEQAIVSVFENELAFLNCLTPLKTYTIPVSSIKSEGFSLTNRSWQKEVSLPNNI